jgi:hypothetical protein
VDSSRVNSLHMQPGNYIKEGLFSRLISLHSVLFVALEMDTV